MMHLPTALLNEIFMHWISTKDLVHADTALCSQASRAEFLSILSEHYFNTEGLLDEKTTIGAFQWMLTRRTKVTSLAVLDSDQSTAWLQMSFFFRNLRSLRLSLQPAGQAVSAGLQRILINSTATLTALDASDSGILDELLTGTFCQQAAAFTALTSLDLSRATISSAALHRLLARCPALTSLRLDHVQRVDDALISLVASACPLLETLSAAGCSQLSDASVLSLTASCPRLHTLRLSGCTKLTDAHLVSLASSKHLTNLDVSQCFQVTDAGVVRLAFACSALRSLKLEGCPLLTACYLDKIASELPLLQLVRTAPSCLPAE